MFGAIPLGAGAFGAGTLAVVATGATVVDLAMISIACEPGSIPGITNRWRSDSVYYWRNWTLTAISPSTAKIRLVRLVTWGAETSSLFVSFDGTLQPGALYRLTCSVGFIDISFVAAFSHASALVVNGKENTIQDWAKPERSQDLQGGSVGTYQIKSGDLAMASGAASLYERIVRRATVAAGEFAHDARYGKVWLEKQLLTLDTMQRLQSRLTAQIRREPDVLNCTVSVGQVPGALDVVAVTISAETQDGPLNVTTTLYRS